MIVAVLVMVRVIVGLVMAAVLLRPGGGCCSGHSCCSGRRYGNDLGGD